MKTLSYSILSAMMVMLAAGSQVTAAEHSALTATELQTALLTGGCAGCHGTEGRLTDLPNRTAESLEAQLLNFKYDRVPSTVMGRITRGFTDQELADIAQYFADLGQE